ncbi:DNA ligase D [Sphingomonas baiyangensis]|uniref:DNA ligase (ATP) n=1 Tax=Sphingomonas baiyangensis TaxID=2572576 RepID=A0A4U1L6N9_9SPHN|nr:DNA ligase D [Sphingomonas baiyangensis]TKD51965.1 DNA ligase D [Sphingomonas baiyangensis]
MAKRADPLAAYNAKRDFTRTAEPAGTLAKGKGNALVVQKHDATRLHWDLRLEVDGVLKSWAVTRGPSLNPDDKRLAVRTEDHPLAYGDFEGVIPAEEYGGGTVMLWDRGTWAPIKGKSAADLDKGHLHFIANGERMQGEWLLIRLKPRGKEKRENWLLRKIADAHAGGSDALVETALTSVKTGRTMREIAEGKHLPGTGRGTARAARGGGGGPQAKRTRRPRSPFAGGAQPLQLATLVDSVPAGNGWLHEVKYDGYRALIETGDGDARIFTRSGLDWTDKFPGIAEAFAAIATPARIDSEIVALKDGRPDFSTLQDAISNGGEMLCFAFDLLEADGEDVTGLPLVQRKERLRALLPASDARIQFAEHVVGAGEKLFEAMCAEGYEGIVAKRIDAPYRAGRTKAWLKVKCTRRQEFVIVGWQPSKARGRPFASLLLALHEDGGLRYAGKVGTGFDADTQQAIAAKLERLARKTAPVEAPSAAVRGAHWVTPRLVAEVAFAEFTGEGVLRHASFVGVRSDKPANEVADEVRAEPPAELPVRITSPDRVIFPDDGITKRELADYYAAVAGIALPWIGNRPISLVRCPQGRARKCFFQKHDAGSFGDHVHHVDIREKDGGTGPYLYVRDMAGLLACVQMGTIEFHGWGAGIADVEKPDRLVFDLDPDEGLGFAEVKKAAVHLKDVLADIGLASFAMLSGGKGLHVVVPLTPEAEWPAVKSFADRFARALAAAEPDRYTATMSKAKRKGRIFIDWLRNQRGSTAVLPYVVRARPGAGVAAPVSWTELGDINTPTRWTLRDAAALVERAGSSTLAGWGAARQTLPDL